MAPSRHHSTEFLLLRKTPYSETSLVVAGISPEHGQLHFLVRGARRMGRQSPGVDVFRLFSVQYREGKGDLHAWEGADLLSNYGGLARDLGHFQTAAWLARFALGNVLAGVAHPRFFQAVNVALTRLARAAPSADSDTRARLGHASVVGVCLAFLEENGTLPEYIESPQAIEQSRRLLAMAQGQEDIPALALQTWEKLRAWTRELLLRAECHIPD